MISWAFGQFGDVGVCALSTDSACAVGRGASDLGQEQTLSLLNPDIYQAHIALILPLSP